MSFSAGPLSMRSRSTSAKHSHRAVDGTIRAQAPGSSEHERRQGEAAAFDVEPGLRCLPEKHTLTAEMGRLLFRAHRLPKRRILGEQVESVDWVCR